MLADILILLDYLFSVIEEDARRRQISLSTSIYEEEDYFFNHQDPLINLDYACIAIIQYQKSQLMASDYLDCLKIMINYPKFDCAQSVIKIAERVKKIIYERQIKHQK